MKTLFLSKNLANKGGGYAQPPMMSFSAYAPPPSWESPFVTAARSRGIKFYFWRTFWCTQGTAYQCAPRHGDAVQRLWGKHAHRVHRVPHCVRTVCLFRVPALRIFRQFFGMARTRWLQGFTYNNGSLHSILLVNIMVVVAAHTPCRGGGTS